MKILLADGDAASLELTTYALLRHGHRVVAAAEGEQAWQRWVGELPDLVLLDPALPGIDGFELCRRIRERSAAPIMLLSDRGAEMDLVRGYECGADDYIIKPFGMRQLLVRMDALMRRFDGLSNDGIGRRGSRVIAGDLMIDPARFFATKNGVHLALTRLEFHILHFLASNLGTLVEAHRLARYAWHSDAVEDAGLLKAHISHIRRKLQRAGGSALHIRATPRIGYLLSSGDSTLDSPRQREAISASADRRDAVPAL